MTVVTFLSDYGLEDDFVGVCHGVIARIAPDVRVVDITHGIGRHDALAGALVLRRALPFTPAGVHLAVVDPGVGSARRAVALRCAADDGRVLVGPDNGLLMLAAQAFGGVVEAVDIGASPFALERVSASFHGRDLFAPVAAHLALGASLAAAGSPLDPHDLVVLDLPRPERVAGGLVAHVLQADRFGNVALDAVASDLDARPGEAVRVGSVRAMYARTFADVPPGGLVLYEDSYGALSLAINRGSALDALGLAVGASVEIARVA
jgi:S-adenosylmethionine hydrolase